jgi:hypothetical protein
MGVQILNKDVSVISSVIITPKARIGSILGTTGWAGGGDVTPNPTPNWVNISDPQSSPSTVTVQQIQGITSTINLEVSRSGGVFKIYYKIDNSVPAWTNGGTNSSNFTGWTEITSFPVVISVSNNQYVSFGVAAASFGQNATATITVKNNSDSAITLDTFTATVSFDE